MFIPCLYLGVILDKKLRNKVAKARNAIWACMRTVWAGWGLKSEGTRSRKCVLEESLFHILSECGALAEIRQTVLGLAYLDAAKIRKAELGALQHLCLTSGFL